MRQNPGLTEGNWETLQQYVAAHWDAQIDSDDPSRVVGFDQFITKALNRIGNYATKPPIPSRSHEKSIASCSGSCSRVGHFPAVH